MLLISEVFHSIQGEGMVTGAPSIFIRVIGCNLRCVFKGSTCDTPYTSFCPETAKYSSISDVLNAIEQIRKQYPNTEHIVITGGEPLLYRKELCELIRNIRQMMDACITIETNGTLPALETKVDLYSISPKLSTSEASEEDVQKGIITEEWRQKHARTRYNPDSLLDLIRSSNFQLKFVYSGPECINEINHIIDDIMERDISSRMTDAYIKRRIMLMPEGINREQIEAHQLECARACMENGWRYCDRLHIRLWDSKRGV